MQVYGAPFECARKECPACKDNYRKEHTQRTYFWMRYTERLADSAADQVIEAHRQNILSDHTEVLDRLETFGDKILNRWRGYLPKKREEILRKALPDLPETRWTHLPKYQGQNLNRDKDRKLFLLPYLSLSELSVDPSALLGILDVRTRFRPCDWAWTDHSTTRFSRQFGFLNARFASTFYSIVKDATYGSQVKHSMDGFHRYHCLAFPVAEVLFEAQATLYRFLGTVLDQVLKGAGAATGNTKWKIQADEAFRELLPNLMKDRSSTLQVPLQPNLPPPTFNIEEVSNLIQERLEAVEDDLWVLQTDPISACDAVASIAQGRYFENMDDADDKWAAIAFELTYPLILRARIWYMFVLFVDILKTVKEAPITPTDKLWMSKNASPLPAPLNNTLGFLISHINARLSSDFSKLCRDTMVKNRAFDDAFELTGSALIAFVHSGDSAVERRKSEVDSLRERQQKLRARIDDAQQYPLRWALAELSNYQVTTAKDVMLFVQDTLSNQHEILPESRLSDLLTDIASLLWVQNSLHEHDPRPVLLTEAQGEAYPGFASSQARVNAAAVRLGYDNREAFDISTTGFGAKDDDLHRRLQSAGRLLKKFHGIRLTDRKRTLPWVTKAKEAKVALDAFWKEVRLQHIESLHSIHKGKIRGADFANWQDVRLLERYRDPEFLESVDFDLQEISAEQKEAKAAKAAKEAAEAEAEAKRLADEKFKPISPKRKDAPGKDSEKEPKKKTKVVPDPSEAFGGPPPPPAPPLPQAPAASQIEVSRDSLDVFARLWPHQSRTVEAGVIRCRDLTAAMMDAGLDHDDTTGGSMNIFTGKEGTGPGRLVLHYPHGKPETVIPRYLLIKLGKRLRKKYNWTFASFVEREK
ncbi:hypothetical protein Slin15195_G017230 [Septoria linicola]|uniref:Uncharacterized protein n=1 Tax=Septoria linicola TaxID=215465 RepID=A0A9Q9EFZ7_9PEZI|nr:hypothetical protein Slin14017_G017290 [Septoria linicola]USW48404.1 hypothetical protein Slin15195_G017230 [Septoria linicola]